MYQLVIQFNSLSLIRQLIQINMGNKENAFQDKFSLRYRFIEVVNDRNYGIIKVYRKKQPNFDYVMILDTYLDDKSLQQLHSELKVLEGIFNRHEEPLILKIHYFSVFDRSIMDCKIPHIRLYCEYLNFTLADLCQYRDLAGEEFTYDQILYVINSAVQTYQLINSININHLLCWSSAEIFVSPEGYIKFSPIRIKEFIQQSSSCCHNICTTIEKQVTNFDRSVKHFISDLKKLIYDLIKPRSIIKNSLSKDYYLIKKLESQLSTVRTMMQLKNAIPQATIECLLIKKKDSESEFNPTTTVQSPEVAQWTKVQVKKISKGY